MPRAGHATDPSADLLDGAHQRPAEEQGPAEIVAELGARLGVGRDAARIVVRRARDQPWSEDLQELWTRRLFDRIGRWCVTRLVFARHPTPLVSPHWTGPTPGLGLHP